MCLLFSLLVLLPFMEKKIKGKMDNIHLFGEYPKDGNGRA
jgi:hypothetical protein